MMTSVLLRTLLAVSPIEEPTVLQDVVVKQQSEEGQECLKNLIREQSGPNPHELYEFQGPFRRSESVVEYWVWTYFGRWIAHGIEIAANDGSTWSEYYSADEVLYATPKAARSAPVYEVLRGGDLGNYQFSLDLDRCKEFLKAPTIVP